MILKLFAVTGAEYLLTLQSQLDTMGIPDGNAQDLRKQIQRDCYIVMWEQKKMKRELERVSRQQSDLPKTSTGEQKREALGQSMQMQQRMSIIWL